MKILRSEYKYIDIYKINASVIKFEILAYIFWILFFILIRIFYIEQYRIIL